MDKVELENVLEKMLNKTRAMTLAISGEWGVGKTKFWHNFTQKKLVGKHKFVYVSLFGKEHYKDILDEIVLKIFGRVNERNKAITTLFSKITGWLSRFVSGGIVSLNINPQSIFSLLKQDDFKEIVVCLDDIERLSNKLDIKDFLGFVSQLKEDKLCKVVLILNIDKLKSQAQDFEIFAEKSIDVNFCYTPSVRDNFEIAKSLTNNECQRVFEVFGERAVLETLEKNRLDNIRIVIYILGALNDLADELVKFDDLNDGFKNKLLVEITMKLIYLKVSMEKVNKSNKNSNLSKRDLLLFDITKTVSDVAEFYYKNSRFLPSDICKLNKLNSSSNIQDTVDNLMQISDYFNDWSKGAKNCDEIFGIVYKELKRATSYKNREFFEKIIYRESWFEYVERLILVLKLIEKYKDLNLQNFAKIILDNLIVSQISAGERIRMIKICRQNNPKSKQIQEYKENIQIPSLDIEKIFCNTMQEDEIKWLDKIESLSVQAIKDYILDNEKGLAIMLYNDIKSEIFQQNRAKALNELAAENKDLKEKMEIVERFKNYDSIKFKSK